MDHTESVGDECAVLTHERREFLGELGALRVVLGRFARIESDVLDEQYVSVGEAIRPLACIGSDDVIGELYVLIQLGGKFLGDGAERELGVGFALGAAQVGGDNECCTGVEESLERRDGRGDTAGVGDR